MDDKRKYCDPIAGQWEQTSHGSTSWYHPHETPSCAAGNKTETLGSSKSHSQAEKRRRDRINAQLANLRMLIPKSDKMDKAALLASAVDHIKDLKIKATEISGIFSVPTDADEVTVECIADNNETGSKSLILFDATICCEDRTELLPELISALKGLKLSIAGGDIACLGGRIRASFALCSDKREGDGVCRSTLKQSIRAVLGRIGSSSTAPNFRVTSRRQRFMLASNSQQEWQQELDPGQY
ncbi:hypothetical protein Droror1_Dr00016361 [Drosera rotundifolia]